MNKPKPRIHRDTTAHHDILVVGRTRIPMNFIFALYGIILLVTLAVGIVSVFLVPSVPLYWSDGTWYSDAPDFRTLLPFVYVLLFGVFVFLVSCMIRFVQWSKRQFEAARKSY